MASSVLGLNSDAIAAEGAPCARPELSERESDSLLISELRSGAETAYETLRLSFLGDLILD